MTTTPITPATPTRTRSRYLGRAALAASALVLGTLVAGTAPVQAAGPTSGVQSVADSAQPAAEKKAGKKAGKKASGKKAKAKKARKKAKLRKARRIKAATGRLASLRKRQYAAISKDPRLARVPAELVTAIRAASHQGTVRIDGRLKALKKARSLKRVRAIRALVRAERPGDLVFIVSVAYRAVMSEGDPGILEGLLVELAGADLEGTPLEPVTDLVDGILEQVLGGTGGDVAVEDLLSGLVDLLDQIIGALFGNLPGIPLP